MRLTIHCACPGDCTSGWCKCAAAKKHCGRLCHWDASAERHKSTKCVNCDPTAAAAHAERFKLREASRQKRAGAAAGKSGKEAAAEDSGAAAAKPNRQPQSRARARKQTDRAAFSAGFADESDSDGAGRRRSPSSDSGPDSDADAWRSRPLAARPPAGSSSQAVSLPIRLAGSDSIWCVFPPDSGSPAGRQRSRAGSSCRYRCFQRGGWCSCCCRCARQRCRASRHGPDSQPCGCCQRRGSCANRALASRIRLCCHPRGGSRRSAQLVTICCFLQACSACSAFLQAATTIRREPRGRWIGAAHL